MIVRTALQQGQSLLEEGDVPAPRLTAEVLLSHALKHDRAWLYGHSEDELSDLEWLHFGRYLHERLNGKPTQYILGHQEFYGREFRVTPDVFIPRPETEHVVETALKVAPAGAAILDVGCGSGAIGITLSLELPAARVFTTDKSIAALCVARENARALGARVEFINGDLATAIREGSLDLLVSNPPYIPTVDADGLPREVREFEPHTALFAGPEGLDAYRALIEEAPRVLRAGGWIVFELGFRQVDAVRAMLDSRWDEVQVVADLAGLPRVFAARYCGS